MRPRQPTAEKAHTSPLVRKSKNSASKDPASSATSPILKAQPSVGDLMFQMDEEAAISPGGSVKGKSAVRGVSGSYPDSPALGASVPEAESLGERSFLEEQMSSPQDTLLTESPTEARTIALHQKRGVVSSPDSSAPWGSPVISNGKKDLKDIMTETSQSRVSNLTLEMTGRRESSGNFTPKISQKERKKMQQQQMHEMLAAQHKANESPKNPWQLPPSATPSTHSKDPLPGQSGPLSPSSESSKVAQKPMTLRQTVAGTPPTRAKPMATPTQRRSASGNAQQPSSSSKSSPSNSQTTTQQTPSKAPSQPPIQSIRHIPRSDPYTGSRSPSGSSLSLATILQQQQTEKDVIREAANAKHNLQDIQAEQEFQQWWDQESKRVQGLLDPDPTQQRSGKTGRGGKVSGSSGKSRKRSGNKGPTATDGAGEGQKQISSQDVLSQKNAHSSTTQMQGPTSGNHANSTGASKGARRGGHGHRGRGREKGQ